MCDTSMMPLRAAMPSSAISPMIEAIDSTPPDTNTPATPPMSASGRFTMMSAASALDPNAAASMKNIAITTAMLSHNSSEAACSLLSNWPLYSIR